MSQKLTIAGRVAIVHDKGGTVSVRRHIEVAPSRGSLKKLLDRRQASARHEGAEHG